MAKQMNDSASAPTHEQISARAYEIFIERGRPQGRDLDNWLEAEAQLRAAGQTRASTPVAATQNRSQTAGRTTTRSRK